jgi:PAS domain S-box-containing protein
MKILAIDDNPDNLTALGAVMQEALPACTLLTALNGPRGLELALAEDPDVILLDIVMPGMDGYEVCRRLKADDRLRPIPVVFLTALRTDRESRIRALESGAEAFLSKPFDEQELVAEVRAMAKIKAATLMQRDEHARLRSLVAERTRALRQSEERFRALFQQAPLGYQSLDAEGHFIEVNQAWLETLGYLREEVIGKWFGDFLAPEFVPAFRERFPQFKAAGHIHSEFQMLRKDGERRFIAFEGRIAHKPDGGFKQWHCILQDITERKQAEDALQALSSRQEAILSAIPDIIMEVDCNKVYRWANQPGFDFFGEDVIGKEAAFFFADDNPVYSTVKPLFDGEENVIRVASWQRRKDGEKRLLDWSCRVLKDLQGHVTGALSTAHDITERMRTEAELQKLDKLQSVGTLAGGIAHDFNNILQGLYGNISLAIEDLAEAHPSYPLLKDAEKSMTRAIRLTKQLLTFAKGGDPVKEHVSLVVMVEEVARFDLTGSNVSLVYHHDAELWPVDVDREQIQQVISNLVINACQAMPSGGHLHLTLENADLPDEAIPGLSAGRYVKGIVQDEGGGIDPKVINRIFDPYFSTKQTGHGLGLATAWSIINKHNGHISVVSVLGKGTTFTFYLPVSASRLSAEDEPPSAEIPSPARPAKILVMDDDERVCDLASKMLSRCGYTVATTPDAQQTIALYNQALEVGAPFDLVIMDLTIPGGPGGKDVIKDLMALDPKVRAIVSSGYADDPVMANPAKYGFKGTAAKPYTAAALRKTVARVLA